MLKHLYQNRRYILVNSINELRYKYAGTGIGVFWNFIHPLFQILIYTIIFSWLFNRNIQGHSYVLYLTSGLLAWRSFSETIQKGTFSFIENARYLKRMAIPSEIFVAKVTLTSTFLLYIYYLMIIPVVIFQGNIPGIKICFLPLFLLFFEFLAFGMGLALANLRVLLPDVGEIVQAILPLWFWTLPIIYPETVVPENLQPFLYLNPPYAFIQSIRNLILDNQLPSTSVIGIMAGWMILFLLLGSFVNIKLRPDVKDAI